MSVQPTPPLSAEGWDEITDEIENPRPPTPERRRTLERVRLYEQCWGG
jgi:hypothetical protein